MAFNTLTDLIRKTTVRLRMVSGQGTQLYAEDAIALMLEEAYEMVREQRWWDHLMRWETRQLDGTTGQITQPIVGARGGWHDVQHIFIGSNNLPLPIVSQDINPYRLTDTNPRYVEPLYVSDDTGNIFRIWPRNAVTTTDRPLRIRVRLDPADIFTDPSVVVPFDVTCLVNGAAYKYAADDGTNPAQVASLQTAFEARLKQLQRNHDNAVIQLDPRMTSPIGQTEWLEDWR